MVITYVYIYTCIWKRCENAFYHSMIRNWEFGGVIAFPNMRRYLKLHISFNPILKSNIERSGCTTILGHTHG